MAGSRETTGWDNGQNEFNVTTQALDMAAGAGALDLTDTVDTYFFGTRDVAGDGGGIIDSTGWDAGTIGLGGVIEYVFASEFIQEMTLNVALNWFSVREFDELEGTGSDIAFSDLNLQVWLLDEMGEFTAQVGASQSVYNNTEFLRFNSLSAGRYGLRVLFDSLVFDTSDTVDEEFFGLAWRAVAIPEPGGAAMVSMAILLVLTRRRRLCC